MDRELGHKLIDRLYNSGNLSLKECADKRDELNKLKVVNLYQHLLK